MMTSGIARYGVSVVCVDDAAIMATAMIHLHLSYVAGLIARLSGMRVRSAKL
jgi:hypothetical protein